MLSRKTIVEGDLFVLIAMALFGTYSLFLRMFPEIPVLMFLLGFQFVGAFVFFCISALSKEKPTINGAGWLLLLALAVVCTGNDLAYFFAFRLTSVANAALAHQSVSAFLVLLAPLLLKERTTRAEWLALAVSLVGVVVLYAGDLHLGVSDLIGISLGLVSALLYALLIVLYRLLSARGLSIPVINAFRYGFSMILLLPLFLFVDISKLTDADYGIVVAFGLLFSVIASAMHNFGMTRTRALHVSIIGKSEPVFACLYAYLFLHEPLTLMQIIGGALIVGSSLWLAVDTSDHSDSGSQSG